MKVAKHCGEGDSMHDCAAFGVLALFRSWQHFTAYLISSSLEPAESVRACLASERILKHYW
jgi:hypothetical protein